MKGDNGWIPEGKRTSEGTLHDYVENGLQVLWLFKQVEFFMFESKLCRSIGVSVKD